MFLDSLSNNCSFTGTTRINLTILAKGESLMRLVCAHPCALPQTTYLPTYLPTYPTTYLPTYLCLSSIYPSHKSFDAAKAWHTIILRDLNFSSDGRSKGNSLHTTFLLGLDQGSRR
ncbi:36d8b235-ae6b-4520-aa0d-923f317bb8e9 [Sclerotinia trifoliorum]|uniref:36d8b235-ae6b-4520-aa0d-923f317bb8e9 n=1 Tax=Sclerotinia trifoliorum TaxID=28548 RepID=A0A8H2VVG8_9HELO|nr:36d8b235-ae6b-4520-aa0d-923f317bb8e9 [Sclerotinia trifoliorum]